MQPAAFDRRRDRRVRVFGTAAIASGATFEEVCGTLVDVSAGGARVRFPQRPRLAVGATLPVNLAVADVKAPPGALPIRLRGRATLLRIEEADGIVDGGLHFIEPLRVTEAFRSPPATMV
jgi:hypothetical protein